MIRKSTLLTTGPLSGKYKLLRRDFRFPTTCAAFKRLLDLSETDTERYIAQLPSLAKGYGRFWVTDSKVTHLHGIVSNENGAIEWMKFSA